MVRLVVIAVATAFLWSEPALKADLSVGLVGARVGILIDTTAHERRETGQPPVPPELIMEPIHSQQRGEEPYSNPAMEQPEPVIREGARRAGTKDFGKDYIIEPDGTVRIWDEQLGRYRP
jgi:hypothetical protein